MLHSNKLTQQNFADKHIAPFLTGLGYLVAHSTVKRLKSELYIDHNTPSEEPELQKPVYPYTFGEIAAAVAFPLISFHGIDDFIQKNDPQLLGATLGTLALSNLVSYVYETLREG